MTNRRIADYADKAKKHCAAVGKNRANSGNSPKNHVNDLRVPIVGIHMRIVEELLQDTRYGMRSMRSAPGFTAVAVLTLALGIGVNSAVFSVLYGMWLSPV